MSNLKLVIFDCDGTLVDSQHMIVASMDASYSALGLVTPPRERVLSIVGLSLPHAIEALSPELDVTVRAQVTEGYKSAFQKLRADDAHQEPLYPGTREIIEVLMQRDDMLLAIATGKSIRGVDALIARESFHDVFASIQTADTNPSKPHPAMIEEAMSETGVTAQNTIMVGDTTFDMDMARNAGVMGVGVPWGYHDSEDLVGSGASVVLSSFDELSGIVDQFERAS